MAIIHRIGTPENDSEARAIKRFGKDLPDDCFVFHNFEVTTGRGLPYEYDIAVLTPHALYHVEVKGYHGEIRGNPMQWIFENGGVFPSPIPLANKKTKILAGKLKQYSHRLDGVFVETLILLTEDLRPGETQRRPGGAGGPPPGRHRPAERPQVPARQYREHRAARRHGL